MKNGLSAFMFLKEAAIILAMILSFISIGCGVLSEDSEHDSEGPEMRPGDNCQSCHAFSVSGTLFPAADAAKSEGIEGGKINIIDADGKELSLTSNRVGNFYTEAALRFPISVEVERGESTQLMSASANTGACSSCHTNPPQNAAPGRVFIE